MEVPNHWELDGAHLGLELLRDGHPITCLGVVQAAFRDHLRLLRGVNFVDPHLGARLGWAW